MRVYIQWTKDSPEDWTPLEIRSPQSQVWRSLPKRPVPRGGETIGNQAGYLFDLNVQGVSLGGYDHYALQPFTDPIYGFGLKVTIWQDDPDEFPPGTRYGQVWEFFELAPDRRVGNRMNTRQRATRYAEAGAPAWLFEPTSTWIEGAIPVSIRPWSEFPMPPATTILHGIWTDKEQEHYAARMKSPRWEEWVS